jgi:hypothetical protein
LPCDLLLLFFSEGTSHTTHAELGREGKGWVLRAVRILEIDRLDTDEVFIAVWADLGIRCERDTVRRSNISLADELLGSLLLSVTNVNRNSAIAKILESRGLAVILPSDGCLLDCIKDGGGNRICDIGDGESAGGEGEEEEEWDGMYL